MAEISTIARPYAEALLKAVKDSKEEGLAQKLIPVLDTIDEIVADPKLTAQYRELLNHENKEADVTIETAFPLSDDQVADLIKALDKKFPGIKLLPKVVVDKDLIGGVRVIVGDKVLDGTVKARLAEMQSALTS